MFIKKAAWTAGAFILFSGVALAQVTVIQGQVKGEDGQPFKDALVKIERKDIRGHYQVKTNKKGEYYYGGLPLGLYDLTLEVDGKEVDKTNGVRTSIGEPRVINFDMQALKTRHAALQKAAETGSLTQEQARQMSAEERAALEKAAKDRQAAMAKNKLLNDAFNAGMGALSAKQYDQAVEAFNKALPIADTPVNQKAVLSNLAEAYAQMAQSKAGPERETALKSAFETYQKLIALDPVNPGAHNNYALALARGHKFQEAQDELKKAAELDPPQAGKYYYNLGALLVNAGQYDPAGEAFKKAIELTPNYAEAHYQYAVCLSAKMSTTADGKTVAPPGMKEELDKYLALAPSGPNAEAAKVLLSTLDSTVQTTYTNPNAPPPKKGKKK
jgi:tetratricopeptide (TPR) repeat protein